MCTDHDSRPPIAPISGAAIDAGTEIIKGAGGADLRVFVARPEQSTGAGILILPDVRGLHPFYEQLALRFAEAGIDSVAIDFFARTAPSEDRSEAFDFMSQVSLTKPDTLQADIAAAAAYLRTADGGQVKSLYSVGFCFGGALSYLQAASGLGYAGVIGFYGWPSGLKRWPDRPKPVDAVPKYKCAVQSIFGGADEGIPPADVEAFDAACRKAGIKHDLKVYPGAPHSFFDRKYTEFAEASADAWKRVQAFVSGK